jgi:hypothetical protein
MLLLLLFDTLADAGVLRVREIADLTVADVCRDRAVSTLLLGSRLAPIQRRFFEAGSLAIASESGSWVRDRVHTPKGSVLDTDAPVSVHFLGSRPCPGQRGDLLLPAHSLPLRQRQ